MSDTKLHKILDSLGVPREVWIGTDSVADRLEWVRRRLEMQELTIRNLRDKATTPRSQP